MTDEYPIEDILVTQITDKWLLGLVEECDAQKIPYKAQQRTTPSWGTLHFLEIPTLKATVGPSIGQGQLMLCPDEDPFDFNYVSSYSYGPRDLAEMLIRKRLRQLESK